MVAVDGSTPFRLPGGGSPDGALPLRARVLRTTFCRRQKGTKERPKGFALGNPTRGFPLDLPGGLGKPSWHTAWPDLFPPRQRHKCSEYIKYSLRFVPCWTEKSLSIRCPPRTPLGPGWGKRPIPSYPCGAIGRSLRGESPLRLCLRGRRPAAEVWAHATSPKGSIFSAEKITEYGQLSGGLAPAGTPSPALRA